MNLVLTNDERVRYLGYFIDWFIKKFLKKSQIIGPSVESDREGFVVVELNPQKVRLDIYGDLLHTMIKYTERYLLV